MPMSEPSNSSGDLAVGTTAVCGVPGFVTSVTLSPAAADCSVLIYDNKSAASGTVVARLLLKANTGSQQLSYESPIVCNAGITAVVAGTGAVATITFQRSS